MPRPPSRNDAPMLSAEGFEGPLDWLLDMARAHKIDLAELPIAALIQSFVEALEERRWRDPDGQPPVLSRWGDWLVMAATLTQLRSRLLSADGCGRGEGGVQRSRGAAAAARRPRRDASGS